MVERACETSRQERPAMEPESSMRSVVSKTVRKEYGSSPRATAVEDLGVSVAASGLVDDVGGSSSYTGAVGGSVGPDAAVGEAVYAGGGSFEGTVNAFMPGRSGRLVGGERFAKGNGFRGAICWLARKSTALLVKGQFAVSCSDV